MKRYLIAFLLLGLTALARAGEQVPVSTALTWPDCVLLAARSNPDLLAALEALEASRASYKGSFNGIFPQLSLSNIYTDNKTPGTASNIAVESKTWLAQGVVSLDLIDFAQWASIQSASAALKQSRANHRVASASALLSLYKTFAGLLYAQESIGVNTAIRDTWKTNAQMVNLRYQSGRESKGNNMNTHAQYQEAQAALDQSNRDLLVSQQELGQSLGKDAFSALIVTGTWSAPPAPSPRPDFDAFLANHPQIQAQEAAVEQARDAIKTAHSSLWPTLALNYRRGAVGNVELPTNPFWTFTGEVTYPLFGAGPTATYYASSAANRSFNKAQQDLRSLRNQLRSALASAWSSYAQAEDQVKVQRAFLDAAYQRKVESDVRYQSGLMTFDNWIIVVNAYVATQTSFLKSEQNLILAEAQWRFAQGDQL